MNTKSLNLYKEQLLALRARLRGDVNQMAGIVLEKALMQTNGKTSAMPIAMADVVTDNFEQDFTLGLMQNKDRILRQIEESLERIEDGVYGICEKCNAKIPSARLNAIPYAILCVKCASQRE